MALTWGATWSALGLVLSSIAFLILRARSRPIPIAMVFQGAMNWALLGAIGGTVFAIALSVAERRVRSVQQLSVKRAAFWGALAGLAVPLAYPNLWMAYNAGFLQTLILIPLCSALVSASAAGSLAIAQRSAPLLAPSNESPVLGVPES
jgi:hypothetical protein